MQKAKMLIVLAFVVCSVVFTTPSVTAAVFDSNGKRMGEVVGVMQGTRITIIAVKWNGHSYPVELMRETYSHGGSLFYSSADCSGTPYLLVDSSPWPASGVFRPGNTLYGETGSPQMTELSSRREDADGTCYAETFETLAVPVLPLLNLDVEFTPPFTAK